MNVIMICPNAMLPQADALAEALGLPAGNFTQAEGDDHMLCAFPAGPAFRQALGADLPAWVKVIDADGEGGASDPDKLRVFVSQGLEGWAFLERVRAWDAGS
jgi:hypothetical protein